MHLLIIAIPLFSVKIRVTICRIDLIGFLGYKWSQWLIIIINIS